MANPSLKEYLDNLKKSHPEDILTMEEGTEVDYFSTALAFELQHRRQAPLIYFPKPAGYDIPFITNIFGSRRRIMDIMGCGDGDYAAAWERIQSNRVKPVVVESGPVKEVIATGDDLDANKLPIPYHYQKDGGRFLAGALQVAKDPDTGVSNLSYHRMQLKGAAKFGFSLISRGHLWDYHRRARERNQDLDVAVVIGAHPAILLAGVAKLGLDVDEYEIAGALLGEPVELVKCETIDAYVPARAEIVIEGKLLAHETEHEGPFGEYTGLSKELPEGNIFVATAMTHRKNPIFVDNVGGNSADHLQLARAFKEVMVYHHLKEIFPELKGIHYPASCVNYHCYLSMEIKQPGRGRQALMHLFGLDHLVKVGVVVDADIDPSDENEVMWAIATQVQAGERTFVVRDSFCNVADPSSRGTLSDKMGIDATSPWDDPSEKVVLEPEALAKARKLIDSLGGKR